MYEHDGRLRCYNLIAKLISIILKYDKKKLNEAKMSYRSLGDDTSKKVRKTIEASMPELYNKNHVKELFKQSFLNAFEKIIQIEDNLLTLLVLLSKIDIYLKDDFFTIFSFRQDYKRINSLNNNVSETGIILLPRCKCAWEREHRLIQNGIELIHIMDNLYYIEADENGELESIQGEKFQIQNFLVKKSFFKQAFDRGYLKVGFSPVTKEDCIKESVKINEVDGGRKFSVELDADKKTFLMKRIERIMDEAKEQDVDIMIFPEMLGSDEINNFIKEKLMNSFGEKEYPSLVIAPSVWKNKRNTCSIFSHLGDIIAEQDKQYPFFWKKEAAYEGIEPIRKIAIFHCNGIGRIAIIICADALSHEFKKILYEKLKISFLIIQSYSSGYYDFELAKSYSSNFDVAGIWINSCSALEKDNKCIGLGFQFGKKEYVQNEKKYYRCNCEMCEERCLFMYEYKI